MSRIEKQIAVRIALISIALATLASVLAWYAAHEREEHETVASAVEESHRLMRNNRFSLSDTDASAVAARLVAASIGGLFEAAEIYTLDGRKLAQAATVEDKDLDSSLPTHGMPNSLDASYESIRLPDGRWVLRVFVPLFNGERSAGARAAGYFEGLRIVPAWQESQIRNNALGTALAVGLAALLCGGLIFPAIRYLSSENERKARQILDSYISVMNALGRAIAKRDSDTGTHNYRVAYMAVRIGEKFNIDNIGMQSLILGSYLHDVGKIGIPDAILLKPGRLDDQEMAIMRTHVQQGEEIVAEIDWLSGAAEVVAGHHEKWDGTGYPRQLRDIEIPLAARIFAVADVFDALCSKRPYKEPINFETATNIIRMGSGKHFDPDVVSVFLELAPELYRALMDSTEAQCRSLIEHRVNLYFDAGLTG